MLVFAIVAFFRMSEPGERGDGLAVAGLLISLLCLLIAVAYIMAAFR